MDAKTLKTYDSATEALKAGADPRNTVATATITEIPNGPFKGRIYGVNALGQRVRLRKAEAMRDRIKREKESK